MVTGGLMLLAGAALYITGWTYSPYFYLVGSLLFASGQLADRYEGDDPIVKRLRFQQVLGALFLLLTAALMFSGPLQKVEIQLGASKGKHLLVLAK